jgi:FdrA protein
MPERDEARDKPFLCQEPVVVNVGLEGFVADLTTCGIKVVHVDWVPPAGGDPKMAALLAKLGV